jgi:nucleotide-binding universal stress UspA family protein
MELITHVDRPRGSAERLAAEARADNSEGTDAIARVAVAFNGSPQSRDALTLVALVARSTGSRLVVACIFPPESLAGFSFDSRADRVARGDHRIFGREDAERVLVEARAAMPHDLAVDYRALECGSPRRGLRQLALSESIDLLVVGSSHQAPVAQLLPLGVLRGLLRRAPCALAVAPDGFRYRKHPALSQLVVAYDQSPASGQALDAAAAFAVQIASGSKAATNLRVSGVSNDSTAGLIDITTSEADCLVIDWPRHQNGRRRRRLHRARLLRGAGCPLLLVPAGSARR